MDKVDDINIDEIHEEDESKRKPWIWIGAIFLILIFVLSAFPYYAIKKDPRPGEILKLDDLDINENNYTKLKSINDVKTLEISSTVKNSANKIVTHACDGNSKVCYAKALFYFVRDNIEYVPDPADEYIQSPEETLYSGGGDCEDMTILLVMLMKSININSRISLTYDHAFMGIYLDEALDSYKTNDYILLDPTCGDCEFGTVLPKYSSNVVEYVYV